MKIRHIAQAMVAIIGLVFSSQAIADTAKHFETISLAVSFINGGPKGEVPMDILFDPANAESAAHADEISGLTAGGIGSKIKLKGKKISSVGESSAPVVFVTRGAGALYSQILENVSARKGITVSSDDACLGNGCVLVVKVKPRLDILVSTDAASRTGTEFASAFSMMIKKQ